MEQEKAFQSSLLRLVILSSTGLASFIPDDGSIDRPWTHSLIYDPSSSSASSQQHLLDRQYFDKVREQIRSDALTLFTDAGKRATNLSLALRRSAKAEASAAAQKQSDGSAASAASISVLTGLDNASVSAAQQTIDQLTNDLVPKLVFVAQKAWKDKAVYENSAAEGSSSNKGSGNEEEQRLEREKLEAAAKEMGGQVMTAAQLGLADDNVSYIKRPGAGLGVTWSNHVRIHVQDVLQSIAALAEACMDQKTRGAVKAAQRARDRSEGVVTATASGEASTTSTQSMTPVAVRQLCLSKTAAVWEACDLAVKTLPKNNIDAVRAKWTNRKEIMEDGVKEVNDALEDNGNGELNSSSSSSSNAAPADEDADDDDLDLDLGDLDLSPGRRTLLRRLAPLLRMGRLLHDRVGESCLTESGTATDPAVVDLDDLNTAAQALAEAQDDLVAALLYGDYEASELDDDEDEESDKDNADAGSESHNTTTAEADGLRVTSSRTLASRFVDIARRVVQTSKDKDKARLALEDMEKLLNGVTEEEWAAEFDE